MQVSRAFARGWTDLMSLFNDMLQEGDVPTVRAVKQSIEHIYPLAAATGRGNNFKTIVAYLREGGK